MRSIWKVSFNYTFPSPLTIGSGHPAEGLAHGCFKLGVLSCFNIDLTSGRTFLLKLWWKSWHNKPTRYRGQLFKSLVKRWGIKGLWKRWMGQGQVVGDRKGVLGQPCQLLALLSSLLPTNALTSQVPQRQARAEFTGLFLSFSPSRRHILKMIKRHDSLTEVLKMVCSH